MKEPLLKVEDLKVHFPVRGGWLGGEIGTVKAVDGFDIEIGKGETVALVGESGCGKSTAGNAILGLVRATGGGNHHDGCVRSSGQIQEALHDPRISHGPTDDHK